MNKGVEGWELKVTELKAWSQLPKPTKVKKNETHEMYHFKNVYYEEYVKMVNSQGFIEEYWSE